MGEIRNDIVFNRLGCRRKRLRLTWSGRLVPDNPRGRCRRYQGLFAAKRQNLW